MFLIKKILNRMSYKHLPMSTQQDFSTFKCTKKQFRANFEGRWATLYSKLKKDAVFEAQSYNFILNKGACSCVPGYCTPKQNNLVSRPVTQKCKWPLYTLCFNLSYWTVFKLVKTTGSQNRHWSDSMASVQLSSQHWRKSSWQPVYTVCAICE